MRSNLLPKSAFQTRKQPRAGRPAWKCADEFRRWLRKLPCAKCGHVGSLANPIVSAHVDHAGAKGMGTKTADSNCIPLCDLCHGTQHAIGWKTFEQALKGGDAVIMAAVYWTEWPGRRDWERELAERGEAVR